LDEFPHLFVSTTSLPTAKDYFHSRPYALIYIFILQDKSTAVAPFNETDFRVAESSASLQFTVSLKNVRVNILPQLIKWSISTPGRIVLKKSLEMYVAHATKAFHS